MYKCVGSLQLAVFVRFSNNSVKIFLRIPESHFLKQTSVLKKKGF